MEAPPCEKDAKALEFIEEVTKNADTMQKDVLAQILSQNAETEYLKSFNLNGATDRETFKSQIPIATYENLKPFIRRIADGDPSPILSAKPISGFFVSSGTSSGEPKLIPTSKEDRNRRQHAYNLLMPVVNQYVKGLDKAGKILYFMFTRSRAKTVGGLPAETATTIFNETHRSGSGSQTNDPYNVYTSPDEAILCVDFFQSMYTQMLCGLYECKQVLRVGTAFASSLIRAIKFLEHNWQQLTHDIRTGSLNPKVTDKSIRECMTTRVLRSDPKLADFIAKECAKDSWEGIISRIWPNAKYLEAIVTGSMAQYIPTLDYYSGGLPIVCTRYVASECFVGINLNPVCKPSEVAYTIMPNMAYFEFLPNEPNSAELTHPIPVDLVDVKIDEEYELVVTTYTGLYRYRVGDILKVTGFHNLVPQFQFVRRKNVLLSIDVVTTDEAELQVAIKNASRLLREFNTIVVEYTSYADITTIPSHYVVYWELLTQDLTNLPSDKVLDQCCLAMEESFNLVYNVYRRENTIGALEIRVVKNGTFEELMDHAVSMGASIAQYKVPRCVSSSPVIDLLNSRVVSVYFSPSLPQWTA